MRNGSASRVESLQNTLSDLKAELAAMNAEKSEAQRIIADGKDMKKYIDENRDTEARLLAQIASAQEVLKDAEDQRRVREEELQKVNQELHRSNSAKPISSPEAMRPRSVVLVVGPKDMSFKIPFSVRPRRISRGA